MNTASAHAPVIFLFQEAYEVRVVMIDGEPWFVAKDVAIILGYEHTPSMVRLLDDDEKGVHKTYTPGGLQELTIINESGLYSVILSSNKPEAKPFKRWVTHEVLPAIRKQGYYLAPGANPFDNLLDKAPFDRIDTNKLKELRRLGQQFALSYVIRCGVTPEYLKETFEQAGVPGLAHNKPGQGDTAADLAARFADDWQAGVVAAPYQSCLSGQALRLYRHWCRQNGHEDRTADHVALGNLHQLPQFYRKFGRYQNGKKTTHQTFLMVKGEIAPVGLSLHHWLTECFTAMEAALHALGA